MNVIEVKNMVKKFGDFTANDNLTFSVAQGEIFGFLGPNGAGKTTAIRILTGLLKPTSGTVRVAGYDIYTQTEKIKQVIGYMSQRFSLYQDISVWDNFLFYGGIYGMKRSTIKSKSEQILKHLDLWHLHDKIIRSLPLGWKQKIAFAVALLHEPKIVFLDEPTSGVDPLTRRLFWEMIYDVARNGTTVFVTTHYMDEAEYCDRIAILDQGRIAALDKPESLKQRYNVKTIDQLFFKIIKHTA